MTMDLDFDEWRKGYSEMSHAANLQWHKNAAEHYPRQRCYNIDTVVKFFDKASAKGCKNVLEVGGWNGEMAEEILQDKRYQFIDKWVNYELAEQEFLAHPKLECIIPEKRIWELDLFEGEIFVASHVIEHILFDELEALIEKIQWFAELLYLDSPILNDTVDVDWRGFVGAHIMDKGYSEIHKMLSDHNYEHIWGSGHIRMYGRKNY